MPKPVLTTLFGEGGVQTLHSEEHRHRKNYFDGMYQVPTQFRIVWGPGTVYEVY
ncbi:hypothetical protein [Sporosarcina ureae]|uniref:hypothetical protein n=1 Tax=Sporosarcina ureae TaxID=1571 RepID=UPI000415E8B9|nr:hypothetical protein [Sporosarcina ureae]